MPNLLGFTINSPALKPYIITHKNTRVIVLSYQNKGFIVWHSSTIAQAPYYIYLSKREK